MKWDLGLGDLVTGVTDWGKAWVESGAKKVRAKADRAIEVAQAETEEVIASKREEGKTTRKAIAAEAGTKRALIAKNMRLMRRVTLAVLLAPLVTGAVIILATYLAALFTGNAATPNFTPLELFWTQVVDTTPDWWVQAIQGAFAFLWAGGEITNVGAQAGGAILDQVQAGRDSKERRAKEARKLEREKANRERESKGQARLPDNPDEPDHGRRSIPGPPGGGGR